MARAAAPPGEDDFHWRSPIPQPHPWNLWFDGRRWTLTPGVDFTGKLPSFRAYCYRVAASLGYRLRTNVDKAGNLHIQALDNHYNPVGEPPEGYRDA